MKFYKYLLFIIILSLTSCAAFKDKELTSKHIYTPKWPIEN